MANNEACKLAKRMLESYLNGLMLIDAPQRMVPLLLDQNSDDNQLKQRA